ncbi:MAG: DUF4130 domain-containing protein [Methanotrichaceae archaeon]
MLKPDEIDISTDPGIMQLRRMIRSVLDEINRLKGFTRLRPFGPNILYGYLKPQHRTGAYISDLFAMKFNDTIIILGNSRESWISLCMEGKIMRFVGKGLDSTLDEIKLALSVSEEFEEAGGIENIETIWKAYYSSQFCPERENISAFHRRMPKKVLNSAGLEVEKNKNGVTLERFFDI